MDIRDIMEQAQRGSEWLLENQKPDGSWMGLADARINGYYKAPWAFIEMGQPAAANRCLNYIRGRFLTGEGDFIPRKTSFHYLYCNAYIIVGSSLGGRYDISLPALRFLLMQQNMEQGGFNSKPGEPGRKMPSDTISAGAGGIACLAAGQIERARLIGDYLGHIVSIQPDPRDRFFTSLTAEGRLDTDMRDKDDDTFFRVVETNKANQCWYAAGLPFAFLVRLAEATNESRYRDLARWYFDFQNRCVEPWDGYSSGKAGWGCAMLYRITGEKTYRDIALHVAEKIIDRQKVNGSWAASDTPTEAEMDLTAEFTLWLSLISTNVLARDECRIPVRLIKRKLLARFEKGQGWRGVARRFYKYSGIGR